MANNESETSHITHNNYVHPAYLTHIANWMLFPFVFLAPPLFAIVVISLNSVELGIVMEFMFAWWMSVFLGLYILNPQLTVPASNRRFRDMYA